MQCTWALLYHSKSTTQDTSKTRRLELVPLSLPLPKRPHSSCIPALLQLSTFRSLLSQWIADAFQAPGRFSNQISTYALASPVLTADKLASSIDEESHSYSQEFIHCRPALCVAQCVQAQLVPVLADC